MRLVVIGSGTLTPSATRGSSGYWLEAGPHRIGLDCGPGTVHGLARRGLPWERLTHLFVSHFHMDHVGDLGALLYALKDSRSGPRQEPFTLLGPAGLRSQVELFSQIAREDLLDQEFPAELVELAPGTRLELGGGVVLAVAKTPHNPESLAVRIDAGGRGFGFTGDTGPSAELSDFFAGVDVLLSECSDLDPPHDPAHLAVTNVVDLATQARARHLVATHSYFDPDEERLQAQLAQRFNGPVSVAWDGLIVEIA